MSLDGARVARYWAKVDRRGSDECWPWIAFRNEHGYGMFRGDGDQLAHRFAYRVASSGPIPAGMVVCHRCDNPPCQNPAHLFLGTPQDNWDDMTVKGRRRFPTPRAGEANPASRFTDAEVAEMCVLYERGTTQSEIARQFGTRQSVVGKIMHTRAGSTIDGSTRRARGLRNTNGKLSDDDAVEIRRAYAAGEASQTKLGEQFGVSQATISSVVLRKHRI